MPAPPRLTARGRLSIVGVRRGRLTFGSDAFPSSSWRRRRGGQPSTTTTARLYPSMSLHASTALQQVFAIARGHDTLKAALHSQRTRAVVTHATSPRRRCIHLLSCTRLLCCQHTANASPVPHSSHSGTATPCNGRVRRPEALGTTAKDERVQEPESHEAPEEAKGP